MSDLFICNKNDVLGHASQFENTDWIDLPDGRILVSANFHSEFFMNRWMAQPHVEKVTHDEPVSKAHGETLKHLGVKEGHTKSDVVKQVKKVHRLFGR